MNAKNIVMAITLPEGPERQKYLDREILRTACAYNVTCQCGAILDCRSAVNIEVYRDARQVLDRTYCPACGAKVVASLPQTLPQLQQRLGGIMTSNVIDGTTLYPGRKK